MRVRVVFRNPDNKPTIITRRSAVVYSDVGFLFVFFCRTPRTHRRNDVVELLVENHRLLSSDEAEEQRGGQEQPFQEEGGRDRDIRSETQVGGDIRAAEEGNQTHTDRESVMNSPIRSV